MAIKSKFNALLLTASLLGAPKAAKACDEAVDVQALTKTVLTLESGGKRHDSRGRLIASRKGAKGEMQVMDATRRNPGFNVAPAQDNSADERARVGRDYLIALTVEYRGNIAQTLAAYNAGPRRLKEAMARAARDKRHTWLQHLPQETQHYVRNGLKLMNKFCR